MWFSIQLMLIFSVIDLWHDLQVDFVLAYPQAPIYHDLYMNFPKGIEKNIVNGNTHVLKLIIYT